MQTHEEHPAILPGPEPGVDCSLIDEMLQLNPEERLRWLEGFIRGVLEIRGEAGA
jgi:hypothetical protein